MPVRSDKKVFNKLAGPASLYHLLLAVYSKSVFQPRISFWGIEGKKISKALWQTVMDELTLERIKLRCDRKSKIVNDKSAIDHASVVKRYTVSSWLHTFDMLVHKYALLSSEIEIIFLWSHKQSLLAFYSRLQASRTSSQPEMPACRNAATQISATRTQSSCKACAWIP